MRFDSDTGLTFRREILRPFLDRYLKDGAPQADVAPRRGLRGRRLRPRQARALPRPALGGYQLMVSADIFRGRYRESLETAKPIAPDPPLPYRFALPTANHVFLPGHRIMVQVQSSWFPLYDRNPQTFVANIFWAKPGDYRKAVQRIYHTPGQASFVELPLVTTPEAGAVTRAPPERSREPRTAGWTWGRRPPWDRPASVSTDRTWAVQAPGDTSGREGRDLGALLSSHREGKNHMGSEATMGKATVTGGDVVVYQEKGGQVRLEVRLEGETVWLALTQMAELFGRDKSVISRHLHTVFATGELNARQPLQKMQQFSARAAGRSLARSSTSTSTPSSRSATGSTRSEGPSFRIWAVGLLAGTLKRHAFVTDEGRAVLDVVEQYARSWRLLLEYDERRLAKEPRRPRKPTGTLALESARRAVGSLREAVAGGPS